MSLLATMRNAADHTAIEKELSEFIAACDEPRQRHKQLEKSLEDKQTKLADLQARLSEEASPKLLEQVSAQRVEVDAVKATLEDLDFDHEALRDANLNSQEGADILKRYLAAVAAPMPDLRQRVTAWVLKSVREYMEDPKQPHTLPSPIDFTPRPDTEANYKRVDDVVDFLHATMRNAEAIKETTSRLPQPPPHDFTAIKNKIDGLRNDIAHLESIIA